MCDNEHKVEDGHVARDSTNAGGEVGFRALVDYVIVLPLRDVDQTKPCTRADGGDGKWLTARVPGHPLYDAR